MWAGPVRSAPVSRSARTGYGAAVRQARHRSGETPTWALACPVVHCTRVGVGARLYDRPMQYELPALLVNIAVAVGTLAAAVVPLVLFLFERRERIGAQNALAKERQERLDEERQRTQDARQAEVRKVLVFARHSSGVGRASPEVTLRPSLSAWVQNASGAPIFDVVARIDAPVRSTAPVADLLDPAGQLRPLPARTLSEGPSLGVSEGRGYSGTLLEGTERTVDGREPLPAGWDRELREHQVWVEFTDTAQRRWARCEDGTVERLPTAPAHDAHTTRGSGANL